MVERSLGQPFGAACSNERIRSSGAGARMVLAVTRALVFSQSTMSVQSSGVPMG